MSDSSNQDDAPYGYDVEIELNGFEFTHKHFTGNEAKVRRKCMMVTRAKRVVSMTPYTRKQWIATYGDPTVRNAFS